MQMMKNNCKYIYNITKDSCVLCTKSAY